MIRVIYRDGTEDLVAQKFLDILLFMDEVQMFRRDNNWAVVGVDKIRNGNRIDFPGNERRLHQGTELQTFALCS